MREDHERYIGQSGQPGHSRIPPKSFLISKVAVDMGEDEPGGG